MIFDKFKSVFLVISYVVSLALGGLATWFYFVKYKRMKNEEKAKDSIEDSEKEDAKRDELKEKIRNQIDRNKELRDKLNKILGE